MVIGARLSEALKRLGWELACTLRQDVSVTEGLPTLQGFDQLQAGIALGP